MADIMELFTEFKTEMEKKSFVEQQHKTITALITKNKLLEEEVKHLKDLLLTITPVAGDNVVQKIIITPAEALIERQVFMIQSYGLEKELTLEEVKKLDLLLKNLKILKDQNTTIQNSPAKYENKHLSSAQLIQIATSKKSNE